MVNNLRKIANGLLIKIIIGIVIISFVLSSTTGYLTRSDMHYAAKVNRKKISFDQLEDAISNEYDYMRRHLSDHQYSELISNKYFTNILRQQTLNRLIDDLLIEDYVKKLKLDISNEKIKKEILSTQTFQSNGRFDNAKYNSVIKQMGISVDQYVQELRKQIISRHLINTIIDTNFMLNGEFDRLIELITQQRVVRKATIDVKILSEKQKVSDAEIKNYYEQNKNIFFSPEKFRVNYIKLDAEMMQENVSDAEVKSYYNQHLKQFFQPRRNHYRLIQTKTASDAKKILEKLKRGMDFSAIAKMQSTDLFSARKGGDIGWLEDIDTPDEFKNACLREKNQISGIIKSSFGDYLIIRLDDFTPNKIKSLDEARDEIFPRIKHEKNLSAFYIMRDKISHTVKNDKGSLALVEKISGLKAIKTDWFSQENPLEDLNFKPVIDTIFKKRLVGKDGTPSKNMSIISVGDELIFVVCVSGYKPMTFKSLIEAKDQVVDQLKYNKAIYKAKSDANKLIEGLKAGKGEDTLKRVGLNFSMPRILNRTKDILSQKAFSLPFPENERPNYSLLNDINGNIVLLALDKVIINKISKGKRKEIIQNIMQNYAQATFESIMDNLRKNAKIKVMKDLNINKF